MINLENLNLNHLEKIRYQNKINDNFSQCLTCERRCLIKKDEMGYCKTRFNKDGSIFTIVYGVIPALSVNPIEKKPFFHFFPGSHAITIGTYGCNFSCFWCQNHHLSHPIKPITELIKENNQFISPEELIQIALNNKCEGTSISFNEPTLLFEYSLEVFRLAKKKGLYNTYVSNGYMTEEVLKKLVDNGLDAINIDIKGGAEMVKRYCGINIEKVWRNAKLAKELGVHVEITTLLIENLNTDDQAIKEIASKILNELGKDTPFHINRGYPHYKSYQYGINKSTPISLLKKAYDIAKEKGLDFVYIGNLFHMDYEHTKCPNCLRTVIKRNIFGIEELNLDNKGNCEFCEQNICILSLKNKDFK